MEFWWKRNEVPKYPGYPKYLYYEPRDQFWKVMHCIRVTTPEQEKYVKETYEEKWKQHE